MAKKKKKKVIDEEVEEPQEKKKEKAKKEEDEQDSEVEKEESSDKESEKKKKEVEDPDEEEDEEEDNKEEVKKADEKDTKKDNSESNTVKEPQDVFVPSTKSSKDNEQKTTMDKSVNPDLLKSPLFVTLSSQIDGIRDAVSKKVDALEKSVNDRLNNVLKDMEKIEKFYEQSFYKARDENVAPESTRTKPISKQIEEGKVRYR